LQQQHKKLQAYFPGNKSRSHMVSWFSPIILLKTLKDLVLSKIVGSQLDTRELQSLNEVVHDSDSITTSSTGKIKHYYQNNEDSQDFYFDYIADTGDGWDSTYTVASLLSRDYLVFDNEALKLPRGEFLLMGGDEVYPGPSEKAYENRLIRPFQYAWEWLWMNDSNKTSNNNRRSGSYIRLKNQPDVYAIPGNHDWYDSLIAFRKVFCNIFQRKQIGQWQANQKRSYFAISLPHDWVVLSFDIGLDQYKLDGLQCHYFSNIISTLSSQHKLIVLVAEPLWVYGGVQKKKLNIVYQDIEKLIQQPFVDKSEPAPKIYLNLSGDTHNYQRYETLSDEGFEDCIGKCSSHYKCTDQQLGDLISSAQKQHKRQQIVAGGGGAFLHPTHSTTQQNMQVIPNRDYILGEHAKNPHLSEVELKDMYQLKCRYPEIKESKKLAMKLLFKFLPGNISLGIFIATLYLALAWPMRAFLDSVLVQQQYLNDFSDSGLNFLTLLISFLLVVIFSLWASSRPSFSLITITGAIHGLLQAVLLYGGYFLIYFLVVNIWQKYDLQYGWFLFPITRDILFFIFIGVFSPLLLSLALWVYLNYFNTNQNDLFGSGSIAGYKHIIRLKINSQGHLIVYPIAIKNVVTYTMPSIAETTKEHCELLKKHNGDNWHQFKSCAPTKDQQLKPQKLVYHLIEKPIVIKP
jgi:hypothetical protein